MGILVKVKDLMCPNLISVESSTSVDDAIRTMFDHELESIIVTQDGTPVGIVTERDYLTKVCGKLDGRSISVEKIMNSPISTIELDASLYKAALLMLDHNIQRLFVTRGGNIIGTFTQKDLLTKINDVLFVLGTT